MKNIIYLFLVIVVFGLGTISCNSDDNQATIVGSWEYSKAGTIVEEQEVLNDYPFQYPECPKDFLEFIKDEKAIFYEFKSNNGVCEQHAGTVLYSISDNNLTIRDVYGNEDPIVFTVMILNKTTLKVSYVGINNIGEEVTVILVLTRKK